MKYADFKRVVIMLFMVLLPFVAFAENAESATMTYWATDTINMRSKPNKSGKILGSVVKGDAVQVSSIQNGWAKILFEDQIMYVHAANLQGNSNHKVATTLNFIGPSLVIGIIFSLLFIGVPYMLFRIFGPKAYKTTSISEMRELATHPKYINKHTASGVSNEQDRNRMASDYLEKAFNCWTIVKNDNDTVWRAPRVKKDFKESLSWIRKAKDLCPTDEVVVTRLNELGNLITDGLKHRWNGPQYIVALWVIFFSVVTIQMAKTNNNSSSVILFSALFLMVIVAFLILSLFAPTWRIRSKKPGISVSRRMIGAAGEIAQDRTVTHWSSGRVTSEATGLKAATGIIIVVVAFNFFFLPLKSMYCFFKNYVFS